MRTIVIVFFYFLSFSSEGQISVELFDAIKSLNKVNLEFLRVEEKVIPIGFDTIQNDTSLFLIPSTEILYGKLNTNNSSDFIKFKNNIYHLSFIDSNEIAFFDMDIQQATISKFNYDNNEFITISSTGTGLNKSGSFQNLILNLIIILSDNRLWVNCFFNYIPDTLSIIDYDQDKSLDYIQFKSNPVLMNSSNAILYRFNSNTNLFYQAEKIHFIKRANNKIKITKY